MNTGPQAPEGEPTNRLLHFIYQGQSLGLPHYVSIEDQIRVVKSHFNISNEAVVFFVVKPDGLMESRIPESSWRFIGDPVNNLPRIFVRAPGAANPNQPLVTGSLVNTLVNPLTSSHGSSSSHSAPRANGRTVAQQSGPFSPARFESPSAHVINTERATFGPPNVANGQNASGSSTMTALDGNASHVDQMDVDGDSSSRCANNRQGGEVQDSGNDTDIAAMDRGVTNEPQRHETRARSEDMQMVAVPVPVTPPRLGTNDGDLLPNGTAERPGTPVAQLSSDMNLANKTCHRRILKEPGNVSTSPRIERSRHSKNDRDGPRRDSDLYMDTEEEETEEDEEEDASDASSIAYAWRGGGRVVPYRSGARNPVKCKQCQSKPGSICREQQGPYASRCFECRKSKNSCSLSLPQGPRRDHPSHKDPQDIQCIQDSDDDHPDYTEMVESGKRGRGRPRTIPFGPHLPKPTRSRGRPRKHSKLNNSILHNN